jgi:hypothetical protein
MLVYWRFIIAFIAVSITSVVFFYLVKLSIYDIKFSDTLPSKGIKDIPPSDTILPNIFAQIPLATPPTETTQPTVNSTNSLKTFNIEVTPQQCFEYAKECRDVQCAFQDFNVICNKNNNGPVCKYKNRQEKIFFSVLFKNKKKIII